MDNRFIFETGVNALIVVPLETKSTDNFSELEFGRGFGYRNKLRIDMPDIGNALMSEIVSYFVR